MLAKYHLLTASASLAALLSFAGPADAEPSMFIPLGSENRVLIVDAATDRIDGEIGGIDAVHGLAGTPDGRFLVAGSYQEQAVGAAAVEKPVGISEDEHAAHHGGAASASQGEGVGKAMVSTVTVLRVADGAAVRRIDVPGAVHHVAIDPGGRYAAVTHPNGGGISLIDLETYEVASTIETGPFPNYAVFSSDGATIYVSNAGNDTVSAVDARAGLTLWRARVGGSPEHVVLSPDGETLYVNNVNDGTVSVVDVASREEVDTIFVGETLHGIDLSDDGRTLFVAALGDDKLVAHDLETGEQRGLSLAPEPYHLATVRGMGKLYVSSADEPKLWIVDQASLAVLGEIEIGGKGHQMVQGVGG